ncbi:MAG: nucleoside hydrolase, partial [Actinobacteria bacterium]|nr:nucleoside hydrolase [Actinomycetota bacterium]
TDIPVAVGAHDHLAHPFHGGAPHVHGENGLGGIDLPATDARPAAEDAADMLIRLSHEYAGELEVLTVGPLTNLGIALQRDPSLPARIAAVTTMGGAALVPGNITPVAEANIGNDPEAAALHVAAGWPVVLVPLDATMEQTFEEEHRDALVASGDPLAVAVGGMLDHYFDFYVDVYGRRSSALHDPLAAALAVGGAVATVAPAVPVDVDTTDGPGRGQTVCGLRGQRLGPVDREGATVRVVLEVAEPLAPHLLERILTRTASAVR